jgi:hypothetical protein
MSSLQYRRYALIRPSSLPPFSPHLRRQFSTFITSPSSMYPRTPLPSTFNTSRFPLGAPSVSIHLSQCRLLCPCVAHIRRMRDRPRHFVYFKFVFSPAVSAVFSLQLFNTYVESVLSMQFYSVPSQALGLVESVPTSPTFLRRPDVHLSLMSGWVQLGMNSCWIQTVCLHLIGSVLMFSNRSLHLVLASCGEPSIMRYSILVPRFQLLVFRFRVPRSSFSVQLRFPRLSVFRPLAPPSLSLPSSLPRRLDVHLLLISGWVHLSRTHAGFRWCASSIGSVSTVILLPCRQVLAPIVPSRLRYISSGRWR